MDLTKLASELTLLQPGWLWLILVFVPLWLLLSKHGWLQNGNDSPAATSVKHPLASEFQNPIRNKNRSSGYQYLSLFLISMILLALAQPVRLGEKLPATSEPLDIMLIVDTSVSMVLRDYQLNGERVNRMTMMQVLLDRFTRRYSGSRIGLVVLGEQPHILLQPTSDKALVRHYLHRLKPAIGGRLSSIGDAIALTATHLADNNDAAETAMILISDAVTPFGKLSPVAGAKRAADAGVILHTIAVGSKNGPKSQWSELLYEPADTLLLKQLAEITGGKSFHAVDVAAMDLALLTIETHHLKATKTEFSGQLQTPLYLWPLLVAIFLLLMKSIQPALMATKA